MSIRTDQLRGFLDACSSAEREEIFRMLRQEFHLHPLEEKWNIRAETILEAIDRAEDLTQRGTRGVLAETVFRTEVVPTLPGAWCVLEIAEKNAAYDVSMTDGQGSPLKIQVKLQRRVKGEPLMSRTHAGYYIVETQRTRTGKKRNSNEDTRPYKFGEFEILAVSLHPSSGDWHRFMYTVASWLVPRADNQQLLAIMQPVAPTKTSGWTPDFNECVAWLRADVKRSSVDL